MSKLIDLTGKVYENITVLQFHSREGHQYFWWCRCECGTEWRVNRSALGKERACSKCKSENRKTHGLSSTREYKCWVCMIQRCTNSNTPYYRHYGGRGISVCEPWLKSFDAFFLDMGFAPSNKHSLGRLNNDGNYEPDNVEWQTQKEQSLNTRHNHRITCNGITKCVTEWASDLNLNYITIINRLSRGKTIEQALSPVKECNKKKWSKHKSNREKVLTGNPV